MKKLKVELDLCSEKYGKYKEPDTKKDINYQRRLLELVKQYPIRKIRLVPDYDEIFEYLYIFEPDKKLNRSEIDMIESELNKKMDEYCEKNDIHHRKYAIMEDISKL